MSRIPPTPPEGFRLVVVGETIPAGSKFFNDFRGARGAWERSGDVGITHEDPATNCVFRACPEGAIGEMRGALHEDFGG